MATEADPTGSAHPRGPHDTRQRWLLGLGPLALIVALIGLFYLLDGPGLGNGGDDAPPVEELVVERTTLRPGEIHLTVRNEGPDAVRIAQVNVGDYYADFNQTRPSIGRLESSDLTISYPWIKGEPLDMKLVTSTGGSIITNVVAATESPEQGPSFFALMALLGLYVGIVPVALGMLWMPFVRRSSPQWIRGLLAFTVGLLAFLTVDAVIEGTAVVAGSDAFEGPVLVFLGALIAYVVLEGVEGYAQHRAARAATASPGQNRASGGALDARWLALLIAVGIGLHNLGEGLAIGSAYAIGALALGTFLVVGFAIHNTTEGLAIVTPLANKPPSLGRLALLGLIAGGPAVIGAVIGASAYQPALAAFLLGVGAGAIAQVAVKLLPLLRDDNGRTLTPLTSGGIVLGVALLYATSLLVA